MSKHSITLNHAPISWALDEGWMRFFDIPAATFWLNPSLLHILQPLRAEVGAQLYRLLVAYHASQGTAEDYHQMVTKLGDNFRDGFLAWGRAVSAAGWGHFEIKSMDMAQSTAVVRVQNPWELRMLTAEMDAEQWGCPFLLGKMIGIFSHAFGENCWADERHICHAPDQSSIEFHLYASDISCAEELQRLRQARQQAKEAKLQRIVQMQQQTLKQLKRSEAASRTLSSALEQAGESIMITDHHGVIEYVNPAFTQITGYSAAEATGQTPRILNSGNQPPHFYQQMWGTITQGKIWRGKVINKKRDGTCYPVILTISPIVDEQGVITHYIGLHADLTVQTQLEKKLYQAQKMEAISIMIGGIAHNFNNLLAGITGNLYLAQQSGADDERLHQRLHNIESLTSRAAEIIQQMLTFSRQGIMQRQRFSFTALLEETMSIICATRPDHHAQIRRYICANTLPIEGDANQLKQVIIHLLQNASHAVEGASDAAITVRLEPLQTNATFFATHPTLQRGDYLHLSVEDNGHGIDESEKPHLFEPFFTTKPPDKGTGLGLSMAFGAVQSHRGGIEFESAPGQGATFHVYLPLVAEPQSAAAQAEAAPIAGGNEWILLADDEPSVRETCTIILEDMGYRIVAAADGRQAEALFEANQEKIALAILDVVMPYCCGTKLAVKLRRLKPALPVIFMTGYDRQQIIGEDDGLRDSEICTKPVDYDALNRTIRRMLASDQEGDQTRT